MEVYLIACTAIRPFEMARATDFAWGPHPHDKDADALAEFAGRLCYQSWSRPNPATASNDAYLRHIIENRDFSIMEHGSATLYVTGASRAFSHQMIRHRHFSYSQLSQRYVDESHRADIVYPHAAMGSSTVRDLFDRGYGQARDTYKAIVDELMSDGLTRKQARDAARYILPNGQETRMAITGNHRAWREFFEKRRSDRSSDEIRYFADEALKIMSQLAPHCYQDMTEDLPEAA